LELSGEPGAFALRFDAEGIAVEPAMASLTLSDSGDPASQTLAITPQTAGIADLKVRVRPVAEDSQEITYAIPLLVEKAAAK
jgi:hypothetical protein